MQADSQAGITIPDRLSMVGHDDIDMAPYTIPPLTTISQTGVEMGRVAAELLFRMIDQNLNREEVSDVVLAPMLVVRQSTAPHRPGSRGARREPGSTRGSCSGGGAPTGRLMPPGRQARNGRSRGAGGCRNLAVIDTS
jgi:hypothetical protein